MKKERNDARYRRIYKVFRHVFCAMAKKRYGYKVKKPTTLSRPTLILCNHNTDTDFAVVASHFKNHIYVVMSDHVFEKKLLGKTLKLLFDPIAVYKANIKTAEVMEIISRIKHGNNVLLFPEGRLSHNGVTCEISPSVSKLCKLCKCDVITFRLTGGFFKQPRWQLYQNKGKLFSAGIVNTYTRETIENLSVEELHKKIEDDLYVNAYLEQQKYMQPFKLKHGVEGIQRFYTVCPKCKKIETLTVKGSIVTCNNCGLKLQYNKFGFFEDNDAGIKSTLDLEKIQNRTFDTMLENGGVVFSDKKVVFYYVENGRKKRQKVDVAGYSDRLCAGDKTFCYKDLDGADILMGGSRLLFSINGIRYNLYKKGACLNKYYYSYKRLK